MEDKDHTDCVLKVGEKSFPAHKAILSARSPVFHAMFGHKENQEAQNSEASLEDVTGEAVEAMLKFIYQDYVDVSHRPGEILAAADKYRLDQLKVTCEKALCGDLSVQNFCERLRLADFFSAPTLRRRVLTFFNRHRGEILDSQDWTDLQQECPILAAGVLKEILRTQTEESDRVSLGEPSAKRAKTCEH